MNVNRLSDWRGHLARALALILACDRLAIQRDEPARAPAAGFGNPAGAGAKCW